MSFIHPVLGEIHGYDSIEDFDAAITAWNRAHGLDDDGNPIAPEETDS